MNNIIKVYYKTLYTILKVWWYRMNGNMSDVYRIIEIVIKDKRVGKTDFLLLLILGVYGPHTVAELSRVTDYSKGWINNLLGWLKRLGYVDKVSLGRPAKYKFNG